MAAPFLLEQQVAIAAVRRACSLTKTVFNKLVVGETFVKGDKSPVTVADFAAQAVINTVLSHAFPDDAIVGEEDSADLRAATPESDALRTRVVELADDVLAQPPRDHAGERAEWGLGRRWGADALLGAIDRGCHVGGRTGRMWTLDPIDGTKGFLRGGQYAVCLALLVDARVELGIIGCPNLPITPSPSIDTTTTTTNDNNDKGALFVAVRGHGAHQLPLSPRATEAPSTLPPQLHMPNLALDGLSFLESVEKAHAALDTNARVAARLGVRAAPVRMDSQAKYAALARGDGGGGVYLRLPVARGYQEKIWVRKCGSLLVEEAGGVISDYRGRPLDFGLGRTLGENFGVVAARKEVHAEVIAAVRAVLAEEAVEKEGEESAAKS
ncbi:3',5'-bisphosphate nucleotidase [Lactarius psammicola]|nr:3',5'-bisphosphate nucleotidase [Lactarius psammicola]